MVRVLVVGGCGYIGSRLIPHLRAAGHEVMVTDLEMFGNGGVKAYRPQFHDFRGKDAVIWLASISNNAMNETSPWLTAVINRDTVECAAMNALDSGVKHFIYASSVAVYGNVEDATEESALEPTTPYGMDKRWCERMLRGQHDDLGATIVRAASVYGYSPNMRFDTPVNSMARAAITGEKITVNGGKQKRCHIHIDDLCYFYQILLSAPHLARGEAFNAVGICQPVMQTARRVAAVLGGEILEMPASDTRSYTALGHKAKTMLDFHATRSIEIGVQEIKNSWTPRKISNADVRIL